MKIKCLHGYFIFEETQAGQVSDFMSLYGLELVPKLHYFTFEALEFAPHYSLAGQDLLGAPATVNFEGAPHEVLRENGLIYNFETDEIILIESVSRIIEIKAAGNYLISDGLILPGSIKEDGTRVTDYSAWFSKESMRFKYSEVLSA